jgi:hypothetical protein
MITLSTVCTGLECAGSVCVGSVGGEAVGEAVGEGEGTDGEEAEGEGANSGEPGMLSEVSDAITVLRQLLTASIEDLLINRNGTCLNIFRYIFRSVWSVVVTSVIRHQKIMLAIICRRYIRASFCLFLMAYFHSERNWSSSSCTDSSEGLHSEAIFLPTLQASSYLDSTSSYSSDSQHLDGWGGLKEDDTFVCFIFYTYGGSRYNLATSFCWRAVVNMSRTLTLTGFPNR